MDVKDKLRAVDFVQVKKLSINKVVNKMFKVHRKCISRWISHEEELRQLSKAGGGKRKRLGGGGRKSG